MGLWDMACSAVDSVCSVASNAIRSAFGTVSSACSGLLASVASICTGATAILSSLSVAMPYIATIIPTIDMVLHVVGLLNKNETTEDIGDRVLQAYEMGIKPNDFSSYDEYMKEIRSFSLDIEKSKTLNLGEKLSAGMSVQAWGMEENLGKGSSEFLGLVLKDAPAIAKGEGYFTENRVESILKAISDISEVTKYFQDRLSPDNKHEIEQKLVSMEQSLNPEKSIKDIYKELDSHIEK